MDNTGKSDFGKLHSQSDTPATRKVAADAELFAFLLGVLNTTAKMGTGNPADVALGFMDKTFSTSHLAGRASRSQNVMAASAAAQIMVLTAGLVSLGGYSSPAFVMSTVGAMFAKKAALTFGLIGDDDKQAKCIAAAADIVAAGLSTTAAAVALKSAAIAATGVGAGISGAMVVLSAAQLAVAGYQAHQACVAE
jgi:hypothetical protein